MCSSDLADAQDDAFELVRDERELPADDDAGHPGREVTLLRVRRGPTGDESREVVHRDVLPPTQVRPR